MHIKRGWDSVRTKNNKPQHWGGFPRLFALEAAPMLGFAIYPEGWPTAP